MGDIYEHNCHIRGKSNNYYIWFRILNNDPRPYVLADYNAGGRLFNYIKQYHYDAGHAINLGGSYDNANNQTIHCLYWQSSSNTLRTYAGYGTTAYQLANIDYVLDEVRKIY